MVQCYRHYELVLPKCRFCGRDWVPPRYVSAKQSFCSKCEAERIAIVKAKTTGVSLIIGPSGDHAIVPIKR